MKKIILYALILLFSCNQNKKNSLSEATIIFDDEKIKQTNLKSVKLDLPELVNPYNVISIDGNYIFVIEDSTLPEGNKLIHIYDAKTFDHISEKGVMGFGPNEIPSVMSIDLAFEPDAFYAYSSIDKKISKFLINDSNPLSVEQYRQPESFFTLIRLYAATDSTFLGISSDHPNRLVEYHRNGKEIAGYGEWESINTKHPMDNFLNFSLNDGWFINDSKKQIFVKACGYRDRIEIFDYQTKKFTIIDGPDLELPKFELAGPTNNSVLVIDPQNPYRYRDASITSKHIYALYSGNTRTEVRETGNLATKIFVFTLSGEALTVLHLDRSIRSIGVDEVNGRIIGITTDEDPNLAYFPIPDFLLN